MVTRVGILILLGWSSSSSITTLAVKPRAAFICPNAVSIPRGGSLFFLRSRRGDQKDSVVSSNTSTAEDLNNSNTSTVEDLNTSLLIATDAVGDAEIIETESNVTTTTTTTDSTAPTTGMDDSSVKIEFLVNATSDDDSFATAIVVETSTEFGSNETTTTTTTTSSNTAREEAASLRHQGKELHDRGDFDEAAGIFQRASRLLLDHGLDSDTNINSEVAEEYATCRLHEALCRLKQEDYEQCIEACSDVLNEQPSHDKKPPLQEKTDEQQEVDESSPTNDVTESKTNKLLYAAPFSSAARSRAFHRRAKAKLGLGDTEGALADARSAAFLGDRKAVALYGRLLRNNDPNAVMMNAAAPSWLTRGDGGSSSSDSDMTSSLFESLLSKSTGMPSNNPMGGLLNDFLSGNKKKNGQSAGNLAQSILNSLSKHLEDSSTQDQICNYLQTTSPQQLQQLASLAGWELPQQQASQLINFCHKVTPKGIDRTVKTTRLVVYGVSLLRKSYQLVRKYSSILILVGILAWIKSAVFRPIPINKKLAKKMLNAALRQQVVA